MKTKKSFSISSRKSSFIYAIEGLKYFFRTQHNSWIHMVAALGVIMLGKYFVISNHEWCLLLIMIGLVIMAEIFNTAIETLTDAVSPNYSEMAKKVKDLSAAAVLISAITAFCVGLLVFIPKLFGLH